MHSLSTRLVLGMLGRIQIGSLSCELPDGTTYSFGGDQPGPVASLQVRDWRAFEWVRKRGSIGFAEGYQNGWWESDTLIDVLLLGLHNEAVLDPQFGGRWTFQIFGRFLKWMQQNSVRQSRANISAHYDIGNDFYAVWLDSTMTYSCALYSDPTFTLAQAQTQKYARILDKIPPSGRLLEIGCGWGGFAAHALDHGDFNYRGITISPSQCAYAKNRIGGRGTIVDEDYRVQVGQYDGIVSIEMMEAVGQPYWSQYFSVIKSCLAPTGRVVIQVIEIEDAAFDAYRNGMDIIRMAIFPGGMLPAPSRFVAGAAAAGLTIIDTFRFGPDYVRTLTQWLINVDSQKDVILGMGYSDSFIRLWRYYLMFCIAGFSFGRTTVTQYTLVHSRS